MARAGGFGPKTAHFPRRAHTLWMSEVTPHAKAL